MDPFTRALMGRKPAPDHSGQIRNTLQRQARNLCQSSHRLRADPNATPAQLWQAIGELNGYLSTRQALAPYVAQDNYRGELLRAIKSLEERAAAAESTSPE